MRESNLVILLLLCVSTIAGAINHWSLQKNRILQKIDSPFQMLEPDNLIAFLDQIRYNDYVERSYLELLRRRERIVEHLRFSVQFGEDLVEQAKCAMDYYLMEKRMSYLKVTPAYLKRLNLPAQAEMSASLPDAGEPHCVDAEEASGIGDFAYDHLESFQAAALSAARMEREEDMNFGDLGWGGSEMEQLRRLSLEGVQQQPRSWKFHTLSSYYWRMRGQPKEALQCARVAVMLAPRAYKDIPLLSLGTILFRIGRLADADVILTAAVEHAPDVTENQIALASALAMKHDFNRSLYHFDEAERLDPGLLPRTLPVRNFIECLENLTKKTAKMYSYVEYMKNEVKEFKKLKNQISQNHEKLIQQQVPLSARAHTKSGNKALLNREQYCSKRTLSNMEEPVLFCDFYSDMQMRLESKDVDIDALERDLKLTSESVIKQVSAEFQKQLNLEEIKSAKAQKPVSPQPFPQSD